MGLTTLIQEPSIPRPSCRKLSFELASREKSRAKATVIETPRSQASILRQAGLIGVWVSRSAVEV